MNYKVIFFYRLCHLIMQLKVVEKTYLSFGKDVCVLYQLQILVTGPTRFSQYTKTSGKEVIYLPNQVIALKEKQNLIFNGLDDSVNSLLFQIIFSILPMMYQYHLIFIMKVCQKAHFLYSTSLRVCKITGEFDRNCACSVQFSSVTQSCPTLCDPMNRSTPGLPVHHHLPKFTQTHVHWVSDAIQPFHPLSSPSPPAHNPSQHQSLFQ